MNYGFGSIWSLSNAATPGTAPPFVPTAADNGLSVDPVTGRIVLGQDIGAPGDPAQLLSNREIPSFGFAFNILDPLGFLAFQVDPGNLTYSLGDVGFVGNGANLFLDAFNNLVFLQTSTAGTQSTLQMDDTLGFNRFTSSGSRFFDLDYINNIYRLGDIDPGSAGNGMQVIVDDFNTQVAIGQFPAAVGNNTAFSVADASPVAALSSNGSLFHLTDITNALYQHGDINNTNNGSFLTIDDNIGEFQITNNALTSIVRMNGVAGFTGVVAPPLTITVNGGIVTNVA